MAKIYSAPASIGEVDYQPEYSNEVWMRKEAEYTAKLAEFCKAKGKGKYRGEVIRFPHADGYAVYMVFTNTSLIHMALGDAYQTPYAHRLTAKDIEAQILSERARTKMFADARKRSVSA